MQMKLESKWINFVAERRWLTHLIFWVGFVFIFSVFEILNTGQYLPAVIKYVSMLPAYCLAAYSLVYFLIPKYFSKRKYVIFSFLFVLSVYLSTALARWSRVYLAEPYFRTDFTQESILEILTDPLYLLTIYFPAVYLIVYIFFTLKFLKDKVVQSHQLEVLKNEKAQAELRFLKSQLHPHFLFNTLNNLYSLTQEQSPEAPEVVMRLSEILDYMLYQSTDEKVTLQKELSVISNYIDLEKLRYGEKLKVNFSNTANGDFKIAPMILLSIVENAFKHGVSKAIKDPWVSISINADESQLDFSIENCKSQTSQEENDAKRGIGSFNIKRQLELIYPNRYTLDVTEKDKSYAVHLKIESK